MDNLDVRIVKLEPMSVASVHAYSESPEHDAITKLIAWAKPLGLLYDLEQHRIFGFNVPDPAPGSPNYGYEFWMTADADVALAGDIKLKEFAGGLYAVARCEVIGVGGGNIPAKWQQLVAWREDSKYHSAHHQWLEQHLGPIEVTEDFMLDLYLPIAE